MLLTLDWGWGTVWKRRIEAIGTSSWIRWASWTSNFARWGVRTVCACGIVCLRWSVYIAGVGYTGRGNDVHAMLTRAVIGRLSTAQASTFTFLISQFPGLPWGLNFNAHTHPIPTEKPVGIPTESPYPQNPEILHTRTLHPVYFCLMHTSFYFFVMYAICM